MTIRHASKPASDTCELLDGIRVLGDTPLHFHRVLTPTALTFVAGLERRFRDVRAQLLEQRARVQEALDGGLRPGFLDETKSVRSADWPSSRSLPWRSAPPRMA